VNTIGRVLQPLPPTLTDDGGDVFRILGGYTDESYGEKVECECEKNLASENACGGMVADEHSYGGRCRQQIVLDGAAALPYVLFDLDCLRFRMPEE
jgi:hypothetical protein